MDKNVLTIIIYQYKIYDINIYIFIGSIISVYTFCDRFQFTQFNTPNKNPYFN
jgi:hypothetical protein